jgi:hypothetical protein
MEINNLQIFYNIYKKLPIGPRPDIWSQIELSLDRMSGRDLSISRLPEFEINGIVRFENVNNCLNTNIFSCLLTSGGQSSYIYLNVVHFFNTSVY